MRTRLAPLAAALTVLACATDPPAAPLLPVATIEIEGAPSDGVLLVGDGLALRAVVRSVEGIELRDAVVDWRSSEIGTAVVDRNGAVRAVNPGATVVSASTGSVGSVIRATHGLSVRTGVPLPLDGQPRTSTLLDGAVRITVSDGAVPSGAVVHVRVDASPPADARLVASTAIELGPPGMSFATPVMLALRVPTTIPAAERPFVRLVVLVNTAWAGVTGSDASSLSDHVMGPIGRTGRYAVMRRAAVASLRVIAGDDQRALAGTAVAIAPRVTVRDTDDRPLPGVAVRFAVTSGGGSIIGADSGVSNGAGEATLPGAWQLGAATGANTLTATVAGAAGISAAFGAIAESVVLVLTREMRNAISGRVAGDQPRLEFRTSGGTPLPWTSVVRVELLSGTGALVGAREVSAVAGTATFTDLRVDGAGPHRVRFTSGTAAITGAEFVVTQELASLEIVTQPGGAVEDRRLTTQPAVRLLDDAGLPYLPSKSVLATLATGFGKLRGDVTENSDDGVVTFVDLRIDDATGTHALRFSTTGPTRSVVSLTFTVLPR